MEKIIVSGGNQLNGEVRISGMKNSVLPIIFSCLLVPSDCIIHNVPRVSDVYNALEILKSMGADAYFCNEHSVLINTKNATDKVARDDLVCTLRASSYLMGAMLSRFGKVKIPFPGGCNFGARPLDLHFNGFSNLGAECFVDEANIEIFSRKRLKSKKIILDKISVGATINMILASVFADGTVTIENCACEPHIDDLITFLNKCGAGIVRINSTVICSGVKSLYGAEHSVFSDMIEALTYIAAVGICKGEILLTEVNLEHLDYEFKIFKKMGYSLTAYDNSILVSSRGLNGANVVTAPYPLFPTDFHPQFSTLLCFAKGGGSVTDTVFPTRFAYVDELCRMGAKILRNGNTVYVSESVLNGSNVSATDLRAGASLVLAALGAQGKSTIDNVNYIVRGYENIVQKVASIGGKIKIIKGE